ncbi:MAG: hypothetical protein R2748_03160 [Bryobacterales bacterium]
MPNPGYTNNNQKRWDKSVSNLHIPHRLVFNYQYELPFGRGKRFLSGGGFGLDRRRMAQRRHQHAVRHAARSDSARSSSADSASTQRPNRTGLRGRDQRRHPQPPRRQSRPQPRSIRCFSQPAQSAFGNVGNFISTAAPPLLTGTCRSSRTPLAERALPA